MKKIISFLLMSFLLSGCGQENASHLNIGTWKTAQTIQPYLYADFMDDSEQIEVLPFTSPGDQKAALLSGQLDMCGSTLVTAIIAASNDEPIKIVSNLTNKCSALVVNKMSSIDRVTDLKGKTIAYVPGTMHHILLLKTLENAGLDPDRDVSLIRIDFFDMGQALSMNTIDAFCSGEPFPSIAVNEGYGKILAYPYFDDSIGTINGVMITTSEHIENSPEKIQSLVTSHKAATEYLKDNQDIWLEKSSEFGTAEEVLTLAADNMDIAWDIPEEMVIQTKRLAEDMLELGIIHKLPDIDGLFDLTFVRAIRRDTEKE